MCNQKLGLTVRCKSPGCKLWFHISCAVDHDLIALAKKKDIKYGVKCQSHKDERLGDVVASKQSSSDKISNEDNSSQMKSGHHRKRAASPLTAPPRKRVLNKNDIETFILLISAPEGSDKIARNIKMAIAEIEEIPFQNYLKLAKEIPVESTVKPAKSEKAMALDSLLDTAFDHKSVIVDQCDELKALKSQLFERPTREAYQSLVEENKRLRSVISNGANSNSSNALDKKDRENVMSIFSHLKLPNMPIPSDENLSQYLAVLRGILDRSNGSLDSGQEQ